MKINKMKLHEQDKEFFMLSFKYSLLGILVAVITFTCYVDYDNYKKQENDDIVTTA